MPISRHHHRLANTFLPGTTGIGKAAVIALASHNPSHIYFTGRNAEAGSEVLSQVKSLNPQTPITFIKCDLASTRDSIRRTIVDTFKSPRLDIFIANAGIMAVPSALTAEGFEIQFGTNYLGHAVLLKLLRPVMLKTADSGKKDVRFVVLSSYGHTLHPPEGIDFSALKSADTGTKWSRYGQSKLADIFLAKGMATHFANITSVSVHPGLVRTELSGRSEAGLYTPVMKLLRYTPLYQSANKGAWNTLWAATADKAEIENGAYYEPVGREPAGKVGAGMGQAEVVGDEALCERLWEWTEKELQELPEL